MKKVIYSTAALALALGLAGCGDGGGAGHGASEALASPSASQSQEAEKVPGKGNISSDGVDFTTLSPEDLKLTTEKDFTFISSAGTEGTVEFVGKDDPRIKEIEDYRKATHGYDVEYLVAEVDNRKGSEVANMYAVNVYDPDGLKYEFASLDDPISDWQPETDYETDTNTLMDGTELSDKESTKLYNDGVELINSLKSAIDPSEKGTMILAVPTAEDVFPIEIERIAVMPHGIFDEVPAYNPLVSEYREWKAAQEAGQEWEAYDPDAEPTAEGE